MSSFAPASRLLALGFVFTQILSSPASALDLDWHGQFRAENNTIFGYTHGVGLGNGYTIPNTGDSPATFQNIFFRLNPRVLVNDNVSLHSDLWFGAPDSSFFGSSTSATSYSNNYYSSNTGNSTVVAHNYYAQVATDFGTFRMGRVPLNWGLGVIWNSGDNSSFDRFPSSGDAISLETKLGAFKFMPAIVKYQDHNTANKNTSGYGNSGASDYTVGLIYSNDDEQVDLGVMFMRRVAAPSANVVNPFSITSGYTVAPTTLGYAYNVWDFTATKKAGNLTVKAEVPMVTGVVAGQTYSTVAGAVKADFQASEKWKWKLNLGSADGQANGTAGAVPNKLTAFYFHPDYRPSLLMFNYNYRSLATGMGSPYDNSITNARFLSIGTEYNSGKWTHGFLGMYAVADQVADGTAGNVYFNTWDKHYETEVASSKQEKSLGFEFDYRLGYDWDESIRFGWELGLLFQGKFNDWNGTATPNSHKTIFGTGLNMLVKF